MTGQCTGTSCAQHSSTTCHTRRRWWQDSALARHACNTVQLLVTHVANDDRTVHWHVMRATPFNYLSHASHRWQDSALAHHACNTVQLLVTHVADDDRTVHWHVMRTTQFNYLSQTSQMMTGQCTGTSCVQHQLLPCRTFNFIFSKLWLLIAQSWIPLIKDLDINVAAVRVSVMNQ